MDDQSIKEDKITFAQAIALQKVFNRGPIYRKIDKNDDYDDFTGPTSNPSRDGQEPLSFEEFIRHFVHAGVDCLMVQWCGIWLGIETDGYTHS